MSEARESKNMTILRHEYNNFFQFTFNVTTTLVFICLNRKEQHAMNGLVSHHLLELFEGNTPEKYFLK